MRVANFPTMSLIAVAGISSHVSGNPIYEGCYSADSETISAFYDSLGVFIFQSIGYCETTCTQSGYTVAALMNGDECLCGSVLPPSGDLVTASSCDVPCEGYLMDTCTFLQTCSYECRHRNECMTIC